MSHEGVQYRLWLAIRGIQGLDLHSLSSSHIIKGSHPHAMYVKFRWRGEKFKTPLQRVPRHSNTATPTTTASNELNQGAITVYFGSTDTTTTATTTTTTSTASSSNNNYSSSQGGNVFARTTAVPTKCGGRGGDTAPRFLLTYIPGTDQQPLLLLELWVTTFYGKHKCIAKGSLNLSLAFYPGHASNVLVPLERVAESSYSVGTSAAVMVCLTANVFDSAAARNDVRQRLQQHAHEQQQRVHLQRQQQQLEQQLLAGELPTITTTTSSSSYSSFLPPPAAPSVSSSSSPAPPPPRPYYPTNTNYAHGGPLLVPPLPYYSPPPSSPPPAAASAAAAAPAAPPPSPHYPTRGSSSSSTSSSSSSSTSTSTSTTSAPQQHQQQPQQQLQQQLQQQQKQKQQQQQHTQQTYGISKSAGTSGHSSSSSSSSAASAEIASLCAAAAKRRAAAAAMDADVQFIRRVLPQLSTSEIRAALEEAHGDTEKAIDLLLKKLIAAAAVDNQQEVQALKHQADTAGDAGPSWTQYGNAAAAGVAPSVPAAALPPPPLQQQQQQQQQQAPVLPLLQHQQQQLWYTQQGQYQYPQMRYGFTPAPLYVGVTTVQPSGRRKALLVGINYIGTRFQLRGCINDVHRMKNLLCTVYGFHDSTTTLVVLTDDNPHSLHKPTRKNIQQAMRWLTLDNRPGDSLFFHFSGHGGRAVDSSGLEPDGYDETIIPLDCETAGHITDDELHAYLVQPLQNGTRLTAVMDCCHSGTGLDLPFTWHGDKWRWEEEVNPFFVLGDVQMFSGCADDETSADLGRTAERAAGGAMTTTFISVLSARPFGHSYPSLMESLKEDMISRGLQQRPQLSSSQKFEFDRPFNLSDIVPNQNPTLGRQVRRRRKPLPESWNRAGCVDAGGGGLGIGGSVMLLGAACASNLIVNSLFNDP